jgi:hypothetical protein
MIDPFSLDSLERVLAYPKLFPDCAGDFPFPFNIFAFSLVGSLTSSQFTFMLHGDTYTPFPYLYDNHEQLLLSSHLLLSDGEVP